MSSTYRKKLAFRAEKIPYSQSSTISRRETGVTAPSASCVSSCMMRSGLLVISGSAA